MKWILISSILAAPMVLAQGENIAQPEVTEASPTSPVHHPFELWMQVKLQESQNIFAGLAKGDFPAILESSRKLKNVNSLERFVRRSTPGYRTQLKTFEFSVKEIERHAKQKSVEGVALGFQQLTLSCVHCHSRLREGEPKVLHEEAQSK